MKTPGKWFLVCVLCCATCAPIWAQEALVQATESKDTFKYVEVSPLLGAGGQPTDEGFRGIAAKGYQAVINLRLDTEKYDAAAEEKLVSSLGMKYFKIPLSGRSPEEEKAVEFLKVMDELKGQKVFIHCAAGVRAGSFILIDLVLKEGMDQSKAEELATRAGLSSEVLLRFARQVIESRKAK
jgi:protein tyrosine phosphatase (PTP) superfamily phosphohydrolase (DUF442 family)